MSYVSIFGASGGGGGGPNDNFVARVMSDSLSSGSRVTSNPTALGEYRSKYKTSGSSDYTAWTDSAPTAAPSADDGMLIYATSYDDAGTSGQINSYEIYIGTASQYFIQGYASTGKAGFIYTQRNVYGSTKREAVGLRHSYNPTTGILLVDAGIQSWAQSNNESYVGQKTDGTYVTSCYFDVIVFDYS